MGSKIRPATAADASQWMEMAKSSLGELYPAKEVFDPAWVGSQLDPKTGHETWVAEVDGKIQASVTFLKPDGPDLNPVANLGRNLFRPESFTNGSAQELLKSVTKLASDRKQMVIARVSVGDNPQQILFENENYSCVGFQPLKHLLQQRAGMLFYVRGASSVLVTRLPISESLSQIGELAAVALEKMGISNPMVIRDGATGYPLQTDLKTHDSTFDDFELWRSTAQSSNPPVEVSGRFNLGFGHLRLPANQPFRALLGQNGQKIVAGIAYYFDEHDRCARIVDAFSADDLSMGTLFQQVIKVAQEQLSAVYTEVDILMTAPRLLKTAEQLGFVPVAYLPAFFCRNGNYSDVVKMVKLNMQYARDNGDLTASAKTIIGKRHQI